MKCSRIRRKISSFMDDELDGETSRLIENHLLSCPDCLAYLHELRRVDAVVDGLAKVDPSPDFNSRVVRAATEPSDSAGRETVSLGVRLKQAVEQLSEELFVLFEPGSSRTTHSPLDEFGDCPPLSISFIYFNLLGQGGRGC